MEELLSLKWNNHKSTFLHVLSILRDKQLYTDATLACDGKFYSVHKLVLSTCSDYFSAMLDRTNCKSPVIVLKDIKCEDLEALLDYMYLGEVNVRQGDLATLIKAAECLQVKGLAVPDDEPPPPRKTKGNDSQSKKRDPSRSPPAKRKRYSDLDDVASIKSQNVVVPAVHRPKSPVATISSPSPVQNRTTPVRQSITNKSLDQNSSHQNNSSTNLNSSEEKQEHDGLNLKDCFVKVEMDESQAPEVETYDLSNEGAFKEEGRDDGAMSAGGGGESVGDLSNDLPEFLQQAADPGAFGHSSFGGTPFQHNEMTDWQGDGSNTGFSQMNFNSAEGSSQQNAPGIPLGFELPELVSNKASVTGAPSGNFACDLCNRTFARVWTLKQHYRTHTGERPYSCSLCSYKATQSSALRRHVLSQHTNTPGERVNNGPEAMEMLTQRSNTGC